MNILTKDFVEFIECCVARDVRFLIVGGYALAVHGYPRATKDLDVWVMIDPDNAERLVQALGDFGMESVGLVPTYKRRRRSTGVSADAETSLASRAWCGFKIGPWAKAGPAE